MSGLQSAIDKAWPDAGEIQSITFVNLDGEGCYAVGQNVTTRIEKTIKSGMASDIPYVRVWAGDKVIAEFCQHTLTGVFFKVPG